MMSLLHAVMVTQDIVYNVLCYDGMCSVNEGINSIIDELVVVFRRHYWGDQILGSLCDLN